MEIEVHMNTIDPVQVGLLPVWLLRVKAGRSKLPVAFFSVEIVWRGVLRLRGLE